MPRQRDSDRGVDLAVGPGVTMTRGKPVQGGARVKLPASTTWPQLVAMSPEETKTKNAWPAGFLPLPHPHHEAGGMILPKLLIDETTPHAASRARKGYGHEKRQLERRV